MLCFDWYAPAPKPLTTHPPAPKNDAMNQHTTRGAYSLLEILAVVTVLGLISAIAVVRFSSATQDAERNACYVNRGEIELQVQLWRRNEGAWPADLSTMGSNPQYFPGGIPTCPYDGTTYSIDPTTHRVIGHVH